jgi:6-phosphofructokinase 1
MSDLSGSRSIAVLTSGGDAAGMNSAVRGVVRSGLALGFRVFGVEEGLQGLVDGGERIRALSSADVSGILHQGGTVLGTARSDDFRTRRGLRQAARNLIERSIDGLVVIGGDGSLSGADELRATWPDLIDELIAEGEIDADISRGRDLTLVGIVGSIDNDMFGTDMTIGADTALHRITEAVDAIQSTASSHQRTFVIEVMGRHCGYLALMGCIATGANLVLIPENPPDDGWIETMCDTLSAGRKIGRRASIVLVAEGAHDRTGAHISANDVKTILADRLGEDARVTILGHVQRGGSPSAFDRYLGTVLGHAAVKELTSSEKGEANVVGIEGYRVVRTPLADCVARTRSVARSIKEGDYATAMRDRGRSFTRSVELLNTLVQARPGRGTNGQRPLRIGVMHAGGPAPGMNAAVRVAVRVGMDAGHEIVGIEGGFGGLLAGQLTDLTWMSISGWVSRPGADLGTDRRSLTPEDADRVLAALREQGIDGLMVIGGWAGYRAAHALLHRDEHFPIVCLPASINNDLPATDLSVGADTALNNIVTNVDKIKASAVAFHRCFIVEVMGHDCGYLALMGGLTTGAECVYLPEEGITMYQIQSDLAAIQTGFALGKRRGLVIHGEKADPIFDANLLRALYEHESGGRFELRTAILGHVQQGGPPSPFDRIHATRLAAAGIEHLIGQAHSEHPSSTMIGLVDGSIARTPLELFPELVEPDHQRPLGFGWWMNLRPLADEMARSRPSP